MYFRINVFTASGFTLKCFVTKTSLFYDCVLVSFFFNDKLSEFSASIGLMLNVEYNPKIIILIFQFNSSSDLFSTTTILTHTHFMYHSQQMFVDFWIKKTGFATTLVATTLAPADVAARVVQLVSYSLIQCPVPTLHFGISEVSKKLDVFFFVSTILQSKTVSLCAMKSPKMQYMYGEKFVFLFSSLTCGKTLETTHALIKYNCSCLLVWCYYLYLQSLSTLFPFQTQTFKIISIFNVSSKG